MPLNLPPGAGSGDMLASNNLSEIASRRTAQRNLGLVIGRDNPLTGADLFAGSVLSATTFRVPVDTPLLNTGTGTAAGRWLAHDLNAGATAATILAASYGIDDDSAGATDIFLDTNTEGTADVIINMHVSGPKQAAMVLFRFSKSARSGYGARYTFLTSKLEILRWDAGTPTVIGAAGATAPTGNISYYVTASGSNLQIVMFDGNGVTSATATDSTYKAGFSGIRVGNTADQLTHFWVAAPLPTVSTHAVGGAEIYAPGWDKNGTTWMQTQQTGQSFVFDFTGTYCALNLNSPANVTGYFAVSTDGVNYRRFKLPGGSGTISCPIYWNPNSLGRKTCRVVLLGNDSSADNWTTPTNAMRVTAIRTSSGYAISAPAVQSERIVVVGDSIPRGRALTADLFELGNARAAWPWQLAQYLGAELEVIAFSGQGASNAGAGNVPAAKTAILSHSSGRSRTGDAAVTRVYIALGTNDGGVAEATLKADITTVWTEARTLWANARIYVVLPLGYSVNAASPSAIAVRDTYNGYISAAFTAWSDANKQLIDLTEEEYGDSMPGPLNAGSNAYTTDEIHPNEPANLLIAADIFAQ